MCRDCFSVILHGPPWCHHEHHRASTSASPPLPPPATPPPAWCSWRHARTARPTCSPAAGRFGGGGSVYLTTAAAHDFLPRVVRLVLHRKAAVVGAATAAVLVMVSVIVRLLMPVHPDGAVGRAWLELGHYDNLEGHTGPPREGKADDWAPASPGRKASSPGTSGPCLPRLPEPHARPRAAARDPRPRRRPAGSLPHRRASGRAARGALSPTGPWNGTSINIGVPGLSTMLAGDDTVVGNRHKKRRLLLVRTREAAQTPKVSPDRRRSSVMRLLPNHRAQHSHGPSAAVQSADCG
jgi:hypothetical protein